MALDRNRVLRAEKNFRIAAFVTGGMLLLLTLEVILKYWVGVEIEALGRNGFLAFVPTDTTTAINVSLWILIIHGWLYVVYLIACFQLWIAMRWPIWWFPLLAAGGVVPFLSFVTEGLIRRVVAEALR